MNGHQLEARAAKDTAKKQAQHIKLLDERVVSLKKTISSTLEVVDSLRGAVHELEKFVQFAEDYYPGCVKQYKAIKALEGAKT